MIDRHQTLPLRKEGGESGGGLTDSPKINKNECVEIINRFCSVTLYVVWERLQCSRKLLVILVTSCF